VAAAASAAVGEKFKRGRPPKASAALLQLEPEYEAVDALLAKLASYSRDPRGFARWAYPWGDDTSPLAKFKGLDTWQDELLHEVGERLQKPDGQPIRLARRSGHGVGKSSLTGILCDWAISTRARTRGVITAMTEPQLRTKTWPEIAKWHGMFIGRDLFDLYGRSILAKGQTPTGDALSRVWRIDAVPWSVTAPSAFAGLHNQGRRIVLIFDEASEIDDAIYEVSRGALTDLDTEILWVLFGNPTQTSGEFYNAFVGSEFSHKTIDSRTSAFANKTLIETWRKEYGEDSDFFRVRVRGLPPRRGIKNFIPVDTVKMARRRELAPSLYAGMPKRMSLDPARFGDDASVVTVRQGMMVLGQWKYSGLDGPDLASRIVLEVWPHHRGITGCAVDAIGIGADACSALKRVKGFPLIEVNVGAAAGDSETYHNLRAELWGRMRKWLETGAIPDDQELEDHLVELNYGFDGKSRFQLEAKDDLKRRGKPSPDTADSLALSFFEDCVLQGARQKAVALPTRTRRAVVW
jgi:hypothetical protein